jgi:hypothetical protein
MLNAVALTASPPATESRLWLSDPEGKNATVLPGAGSEVGHGADELGAVRDGAAVDVGGPERGLAAMDEEAARRRSVRDDALGADAEPGVRVFLVGGDPAFGSRRQPNSGKAWSRRCARAGRTTSL